MKEHLLVGAKQIEGSDYLHMHFSDESLFQTLCGVHDTNLAHIEYMCGVTIVARGNHLIVTGELDAIHKASRLLAELYQKLRDGIFANSESVHEALQKIEMFEELPPKTITQEAVIDTGTKCIRARSKGQETYIEAMESSAVTFALGTAGSGKTYLAVAYGALCLVRGNVQRLVLARPAVEAGEHLGYLPGDVRDKIDPYLQPLYDCLREVLTKEQSRRFFDKGAIEVAPLAFMRGRTLNRAFVILDEGQNATKSQLRMCLTRLGEGARMVVTADPSQIDLASPNESGIWEAQKLLENIEGVSFVSLKSRDVVRHPVVRAIADAFANSKKKND